MAWSTQQNETQALYIYVYVKSLTLEGMKASIMSTTRMPMGSKSNMNGGGGNGGSINGSISNDTVRHINKYNDSRLKYPEEAGNSLLALLCRLYSIFFPSANRLGSNPIFLSYSAFLSVVLLTLRSIIKPRFMIPCLWLGSARSSSKFIYNYECSSSSKFPARQKGPMLIWLVTKWTKEERMTCKCLMFRQTPFSQYPHRGCLSSKIRRCVLITTPRCLKNKQDDFRNLRASHWFTKLHRIVYPLAY